MLSIEQRTPLGYTNPNAPAKNVPNRQFALEACSECLTSDVPMFANTLSIGQGQLLA
ncbi:MAG: hypothetical protein HYZ22_04425 [Chloroflexi bacterium]|nr:hypothetical protein [Chloroflexota bacterium]